MLCDSNEKRAFYSGLELGLRISVRLAQTSGILPSLYDNVRKTPKKKGKKR